MQNQNKNFKIKKFQKLRKFVKIRKNNKNLEFWRTVFKKKSETE